MRADKDMEGLYELVRMHTEGGSRTVARATCSCCPAMDTLTLTKRFPHESILKKLIERGWERRGRGRMACPSCAATKPPARGEVIPLRTLSKEPIMQVNPETQTKHAEPPVLTPRQMRDVTNLLEEHFDAAAGVYAEGWSDQRIAEGLSVPRASVAAFRDDAFGPLKTIPEVAEMKAEAARIGADLSALRGMVADLSKRLDALNGRMGTTERRLLG